MLDQADLLLLIAGRYTLLDQSGLPFCWRSAGIRHAVLLGGVYNTVFSLQGRWKEPFTSTGPRTQKY